MVQVEPFHDSIRGDSLGSPLTAPTAMQSVADTHETPFRSPRLGPGRLGLDWIDQVGVAAPANVGATKATRTGVSSPAPTRTDPIRDISSPFFGCICTNRRLMESSILIRYLS